MLAIATPSIVRQRIILVVFLVVIGGVELLQSFSDNSGYSVEKFSLTAMPGDAGATDFAMAEAAWSGLQFDSQGNLKIDALTETALLDAVALTQGEGAEQRTARMAFLLEKQFGSAASEQVMKLLPVLKAYKQAEQRWWQENGSKTPPPHAELFALQDRLLGGTLAKKMFSEQRRLVNIMLASQQIRNDARLSATEKDQALMRLQQGGTEEGASGD